MRAKGRTNLSACRVVCGVSAAGCVYTGESPLPSREILLLHALHSLGTRRRRNAACRGRPELDPPRVDCKLDCELQQLDTNGELEWDADAGSGAGLKKSKMYFRGLEQVEQLPPSLNGRKNGRKTALAAL